MRAGVPGGRTSMSSGIRREAQVNVEGKVTAHFLPVAAGLTAIQTGTCPYPYLRQVRLQTREYLLSVPACVTCVETVTKAKNIPSTLFKPRSAHGVKPEMTRKMSPQPWLIHRLRLRNHGHQIPY